MNSANRPRQITIEGKVKLPISAALVIFSMVVSGLTGQPIFIAMLPSFCGDVYLMKNGNCFHNKGPDDFKAGVFMFMISHIFYAYLMGTAVNNVIMPIMIVIACVYAVAIAFGVKNKVVVILFYVAILILSVVNTFYFNKVAFVGGVLFLISDAFIGVFDIIKKRGLFRDLVVWGTYVPAQILMMSAIVFN